MLLALFSPINISKMIRPKKSTINNATEAGKETELRPIRLSTPQQASSIERMPIGTYIHEKMERRHACFATWTADCELCQLR